MCHLICYIQFLEELEDQGGIIDGCGLNVHHAKFFFQSFRPNIIRTKKYPKNLQQKEDNGWLSRKKLAACFHVFYVFVLFEKALSLLVFRCQKNTKTQRKCWFLAEKQKVCYFETKQKRKQSPFQFKLKQKNTTKMNKQKIS